MYGPCTDHVDPSSEHASTKAQNMRVYSVHPIYYYPRVQTIGKRRWELFVGGLRSPVLVRLRPAVIGESAVIGFEI
jgi:hypothetical protein